MKSTAAISTCSRVLSSRSCGDLPTYEDLPEGEVVAALYGDHAPADLTACIVLKVGEWTVPVPLGAREADKWDKVVDAIEAMLSAADDATSAE